MNDLMTKSFLSYVDLKKQAMKDLEAGPDIEMGQLDPTDERNLTLFFEEVAAVKSDMEEVKNLLTDLQDLNEQSKSTLSEKALRGVRDRINSDMVSVLRKAKVIKTRLDSLDQSNVDNRAIYKKGSSVDRTRVSVTNGLRAKLRDMMNDFQGLREKIVGEHREGLKKRYYNATGEEASEEAIEKMMSGGVGNLQGKENLVKETNERDDTVKEIHRSLTELHKVFLDMALLVEAQDDHINNIEQNVAVAGSYIGAGTKELDRAQKLKTRRTWACWIGIVVLVLLLVCLLTFIF